MDADYLFAFAPLALGHLAVPPLSVFDGREPPSPLLEFLYDLWPAGTLSRHYILSLTVSGDAKELHRCNFTYMFVHADYSHLVGNLLSAFQCGFAVFQELGAQELYLVFLGGGAAASLPSILKIDQHKQLAQQFVALPEGTFSSLPRWLRDPVSSFNGEVVNAMQKVISSTSFTCGSSGAVSALMGCNLSLFVSDVVAIAHNRWQEGSRHDSEMGESLRRAANEHYTHWQRAWPSRLLRRAADCANAVARSPGMLLRSIHALNVVRVLLQDAAWFYNSSPRSFLDGAGNRFSRVDRAGHLQGAMFGVAYVLARGLFRLGGSRSSSAGSSTRLV
jgi:membrane associated rhomboid family serine protease